MARCIYECKVCGEESRSLFLLRKHFWDNHKPMVVREKRHLRSDEFIVLDEKSESLEPYVKGRYSTLEEDIMYIFEKRNIKISKISVLDHATRWVIDAVRPVRSRRGQAER
jgi:hypothetical protein